MGSVCRCIFTHLSFTFVYFIIIFFFCVRKSQRGKLVNWVEKTSFKKIQRLLEISKQERHHEIILTAKNLRELSCSPSPYIIPVIPRPLPAEIVEGEHYIIVDLLNLAPSNSSPSKNSETEVVGRELVISTQSGQPSLAREDSDLVPQASKKDDSGSRLNRLPFTKKGSHPSPQASKKGRRVPERLKTPRTRVEDFVPWVSPISSHPLSREEEEDEDEMADPIHNFSARKHKRGANFKRATGTTHEVASEASQQPSDKSLNVQAIVVRIRLRWAFMASRLWRLPS